MDILQDFKAVYCDWAEEEAAAALCGAQYFCGNCGSTDHEEVQR